MSTVSPQARSSDTSRYLLDRSLETLRSNATTWAGASLDDRIELLSGIAVRTLETGGDLVADALRAKGVGSDHAGEEWVVGPMTVLRTIRFLRQTLLGIRRRGEVPVPDSAIRERVTGQVAVDVLPGDLWDRILYPGWRAEVWMDPDVSRGRARQEMGSFHTKTGVVPPAVSTILGAGNISGIAPLDLVHKLFVDGQVALLKFNPVNDYIGPYIEHAFADLIRDGLVRTAYGGADVGDYLVMHPEVDTIHITGSETTHDAIVFGAGQEGARRKADNDPRLKKPITSELGNVSPIIVVPGEWNRRAMWYQAGHVATQLTQNAGYNCNAAKTMIVPAEWPQRAEFLDLVGERLGSRPDRPPYYPGSHDRYARLVEAGGRVRTFGESAHDLPATLIEIDPSADHPAFEEEAFCRILAVVDLPGASASEFLPRAVAFANERLRGTLNATLIVDPSTLKAHRPAVDSAIEGLRYGTIGLNLWAAAGFPLGVTPWGAFPGNTLDDVGSGIGFVHNARLIDRPQKTVVTAPFVLSPLPAWSVFHRRSAAVLRRGAAFEADPALWRLPGLVGRAMFP